MTAKLWNNRDFAFKPFEFQFLEQGYRFIVGVDEAGRGAIAGPVFSAAVIFPPHIFENPEFYKKIKDSKELSPKQREGLFAFITEHALSYAVAKTEVEEIKRIGIFKATFKAMLNAILRLKAKPDLVLVDGPYPIPEYKGLQKCIVKGDKLCLTISAASILAKVMRDKYMNELEKKYPHFSFSKHKGYATKIHLSEIKKFGPLPVHRTYYKCFKNL